MTTSGTDFDGAWTVNELMARLPATIAVFNRFGIDTCCGSGLQIGAAAQRDGVDLDALLSALRSASARS